MNASFFLSSRIFTGSIKIFAIPAISLTLLMSGGCSDREAEGSYTQAATSTDDSATRQELVVEASNSSTDKPVDANATNSQIPGYARQSGWSEVQGITVNEQGMLIRAGQEKSSDTSKTDDKTIITNLGKADVADHLVTALSVVDGIVSLDYLAEAGAHAEAYIMGRYAIKLTPSTAVNTLPLGAIGPNFDKWGTLERKGETWGSYPPYDSFEPEIYKTSEWNRLVIRYRAPRYDEGFNKAELPLILEVKLNGSIVQRNVRPESVSPAASDHNEGPNGPFAIKSAAGAIAVRDIEFLPADYSTVAFDEDARSTNESGLVDIVQAGKTLFQNNGCGECHAVENNYSAVKSGPSLYGVFQKEPIDHNIVSGEHEYTIKADSAYLKKSIRAPEYQLAIYSTGSKTGQAYMPIMPRYTKQLLSDKDILAIEAYLLTRNAPDRAGPAVSLQTSAGPEIYDPLADPFQFLVLDRVRMQRGPMAGLSARAVHIGMPSGINYSFDPRTLAIEKLWQGGFLETSGEFTNRGGQGFQPGYESVQINLAQESIANANSVALVAPLDRQKQRIDLSIASPLFKEKIGMDRLLTSALSLEEELATIDAQFKGYRRDSRSDVAAPEFILRVHNNHFNVSHEFRESAEQAQVQYVVSGELKDVQHFAVNPKFAKGALVSQGTLQNNIWTLQKGQVKAASLTLSLPLSAQSWRPDQDELNKRMAVAKQSAPFSFADQPLIVQESNADMPAGYEVESWRSPRDQAGREQLFEALGLDQSEGGTIFLSTRSAGVWAINNERWVPFAEGLNDSLGVLVEEPSADEKPAADEEPSASKPPSANQKLSTANTSGAAYASVVAGQKPELTRIRDVNGDGIADEYLTLYDKFSYVGNYHTFMHGPERDEQGNYWFALNLAHADDDMIFKNGALVMGTYGGYLGWAIRVLENTDGTIQGEPFAYGLRSPASLGKAPDGQLWYADNQGDMVGTSKFFILKEDTFYGHTAGLVDLPGRTKDSSDITWNAMIDKKVEAQVLIPQNIVANSPGNPVWDQTSGAFGVSAGQMIFGDQTQSSLHRVVLDEVDGQIQGAVIPWMSGFESGIMRPLFLQDQSLLLGQTGRGWNAKGGQVAALQRVRYKPNAGSPDPQIKAVRAQTKGFVVDMDQKLMNVNDVKISVASWVYLDSPGYGSDELGRHEANVSDISLDDSGKSIQFTLDKVSFDAINLRNSSGQPGSETGRVFEIKLDLAQGQQLKAYYTAHRFPNSAAPVTR